MTVATQAYNAYKKQARQQAYDTMAKSATTAATTVTTDTDCTKLAQANGVSGTIKYFTNSYYDYSKWASDVTAGCFKQVSNSAKTNDTWTCMYTKAANSFFKGSESHCDKDHCGYSNCLTRGYNTHSNGQKLCKCWIKVGSNYTTLYDVTVYVTYYKYN